MITYDLNKSFTTIFQKPSRPTALQLTSQQYKPGLHNIVSAASRLNVLSDLPSNLFVNSNVHHPCTIGNYNVLLHFKKTSDSSILSDIFALCGRIISPLCENTLSTGAEVAGTQKMPANSGRRGAYASLMNNGTSSSATKTAEFMSSVHQLSPFVNHHLASHYRYLCIGLYWSCSL
jgi:hypothetical protein